MPPLGILYISYSKALILLAERWFFLISIGCWAKSLEIFKNTLKLSETNIVYKFRKNLNVVRLKIQYMNKKSVCSAVV